MKHHFETQVLLGGYSLIERQLDECKTNEEMQAIFQSHPRFFSKFFKVFQKQIESNNFYMLYQPQISNGKCKNAKAEALFRCSIGEKPINPQVAFALAEHYGYERKLTLRVLERICEDSVGFQANISPSFKVSFNVNPTLIDKNFFDSFNISHSITIHHFIQL